MTQVFQYYYSTKDPAEVKTYGISNAIRSLDSGDHINSAVPASVQIRGNVDNLVCSPAMINGDIITTTISGGLPGTTYQIVYVYQMVSGTVMVEKLYLPVDYK
jgi:hypothetical protein